MTAAEILRNARPPADDGLIENALADLDAKIGEWTESLRSAHTQLRGAFAVRPAPAPPPPPTPAPARVPGQRLSAALFDTVPRSIPSGTEAAPAPTLSEAAAAAHIPSPPPAPDWSKLGAESTAPAWTPPANKPVAPLSTPPPAAFQEAPSANEWPQESGAPNAGSSNTGVMPWPAAPNGPQSVSWPDAGSSAPAGPQQWPTWTPTESSADSASARSADQGQGGSGMRPGKAPKVGRPSIPSGPTPEERVAKAAAEEAVLAELDEAIARRVRLLRRLDPDTAIEKLVEKAIQGQAEAAAAAPVKDDKSSSGSSWWRRK